MKGGSPVIAEKTNLQADFACSGGGRMTAKELLLDMNKRLSEIERRLDNIEATLAHAQYIPIEYTQHRPKAVENRSDYGICCSALWILIGGKG